MWTRVGWLIGWAVVGLLLTDCGGSDLVINGTLPSPTAVTTQTPGACVSAGQGCDNSTVFCCSGTSACDAFTGVCDF
ncbi:MAG: hypothetical protein ABSA52_12375 [Candidatus Binatia bacterium]|jgi:hypothetical protein